MTEDKFPRGDHLRMCDEMKAAGITDPVSEEGIKFCTNKCPHGDRCPIYDIDENELKKNIRKAHRKRPETH